MNLCKLMVACALIAVSVLRPAAAFSGQMPTVGHQLVPIRLETPTSGAERAYLGLPASETFGPVDTSGRLLLIEIFSKIGSVSKLSNGLPLIET